MSIISDITHENWKEKQQKIYLSTGITMAYVEAGNTKKPPLILVHGFADSGRVWQYMFQFLQNDFHIFAIDLRGSGQSDVPIQFAYPIIQQAQDIVAFIETLGLEDVFLVGHSMGSMICQSVGYIIPTRIQRIVLVSSAARMHETPEIIKNYKEIFEGYAKRLPSADEWIPRHREYPCQENLNHYMDDFSGFPPHYFTAAWWGMSLSDNTNFLQFIEAPVRIIWGCCDDVFPKEYQDELREFLPSAEFIAYDGVDHELLNEAPHKLCQDIKDFFIT